MTELPTGTVTFLFTDIEGSVTLWERDPAAMKISLARHDAILREAVQVHGGRVFKVIGDAFQAAFTTASEALAASLAAQRTLHAAAWGETGSLRVRMGLHVGAAQAGDKDYLPSHTLNRVARVMSAGHGGQILLSHAVAELCEHLPASASLRDLGEHRLKGLAKPEHLFQLVTLDLPGDFPPLKTLDSLPNNLPVELTSFVGREKEMAEVKRLLSPLSPSGTPFGRAGGEGRLLTLAGPGGTGKTRLALQAAADVLDSYRDGVWLVELAPLSDPALVPQTVATTLGMREEAGRSWMTALTDYLRAKRLLLILDNCEHLVEACAKLADALLHACPNLRLLVSSREALGIAGEVPYRVPSLSLPDIHPLPPIETLSQYDAVRLFVERAETSMPGFAVTSQNALAVAQVCRRLDGIPLAIELAAARVKMLQVEQIAARLDDRFRLLTGGSRTALPRQQTLRALIDWSYDLLAEPECALLRRLSVFAGGWTLEAAEAVTGDWRLETQSLISNLQTPISSYDVLDLLTHLANKSLVVVEREQGEETRYRLMETIRQYARDKLLESGESPAVRHRHLNYFLTFAQAAEVKLEGREQVRWLDRLETEHDNFRAALEWALESNTEAALQLAASLGLFWGLYAYVTEGRRWFQDIFPRFEALLPVQGEAARKRLAIRAKALCAAGSLAIALGESPAARLALEESVALAREVGEQRTLRAALFLLGMAGDLEVARASLDESIALSRAANDKWTLALGLNFKVQFITGTQGDFVAARSYLEENMRLLPELGNPWIAGMSLFGLGMSALQVGDDAEARARFQESRAFFREMGDRRFANMAQSELAHIERRHGHHEEALVLYAEAIMRWQELGHRAAVAHQLECFAFIARAQSHLRRAARLLGAAEALRESINTAMGADERADYDREVSALGAQVDEATFAAAWAEGRAMTMDQAIEYALEKDH